MDAGKTSTATHVIIAITGASKLAALSATSIKSSGCGVTIAERLANEDMKEHEKIRAAVKAARLAVLDWTRVDEAIARIRQKHIDHYGSVSSWRVHACWRLKIAGDTLGKWQAHRSFPSQEHLDRLVDFSYLDNPFGNKIK